MKRVIALSVVFLSLSSCATMEQQAKTEGCVAGGVGGAIVGGLIGLATGRGGKAAGIGAGVGAIGGCVAGYFLASKIAERREELAGKENDLDARIVFARGVNEDTEEYNKQLRADVASYTSKIDNQTKRNQNLAKTKDELNIKVKDAETQQAAIEKELDDLKDFRIQNAKVSKGRSSKELDSEIAKLEKTVSELKGNTTALAKQSQRI